MPPYKLNKKFLRIIKIGNSKPDQILIFIIVKEIIETKNENDETMNKFKGCNFVNIFRKKNFIRKLNKIEMSKKNELEDVIIDYDDIN